MAAGILDHMANAAVNAGFTLTAETGAKAGDKTLDLALDPLDLDREDGLSVDEWEYGYPVPNERLPETERRNR